MAMAIIQRVYSHIWNIDRPRCCGHWLQNYSTPLICMFCQTLQIKYSLSYILGSTIIALINQGTKKKKKRTLQLQIDKAENPTYEKLTIIKITNLIKAHADNCKKVLLKIFILEIVAKKLQ